MNDFSHLKRLSAVKTNAGVKLLTPAAGPGSHCPMHTALALSKQTAGLSTLVVGTPECATYGRMAVPQSRGKRGELHWLYVLDANEAVFGCREGLMKALEKMENAGAKAILLIVTCVPELIGEDMEGILHEIQPKLRAKLAFVLLAHFKCNSYPSGFWKTLLAFGELMEGQPKESRTVNVLANVKKEEDSDSDLPGLLRKEGFQLRFLTSGASLDDFLNASDAALNLVLSPYGQPLADRMERLFNIPYVSLHSLYQVEEIDGAFEKAEDVLRISIQENFQEERQKALCLQETSRDWLCGKRYILADIGQTLPIPLAVYLARFGMEPLLLHAEEFYPDDKGFAKALLEKGYDPPVCHMANPEADSQLISHLSANFCLGFLPYCPIPCLPELSGLLSGSGYRRTAGLLSTIRNIMAKEEEHHGTVPV